MYMYIWMYICVYMSIYPYIHWSFGPSPNHHTVTWITQHTVQVLCADWGCWAIWRSFFTHHVQMMPHYSLIFVEGWGPEVSFKLFQHPSGMRSLKIIEKDANMKAPRVIWGHFLPIWRGLGSHFGALWRAWAPLWGPSSPLWIKIVRKVRFCNFDAPFSRNHYFWGSGAPDWEPVASKMSMWWTK